MRFGIFKKKSLRVRSNLVSLPLAPFPSQAPRLEDAFAEAPDERRQGQRRRRRKRSPSPAPAARGRGRWQRTKAGARVMAACKLAKEAAERRREEGHQFQLLAKSWNIRLGLRRGDRVAPGLVRKRRGVKSRSIVVSKLGSAGDDQDCVGIQTSRLQHVFVARNLSLLSSVPSSFAPLWPKHLKVGKPRRCVSNSLFVPRERKYSSASPASGQ